MRRLLRAPALHFLGLGLLLFLARPPERPAPEPVVAPSVRAADEEILYREALAAGLDRRDAAVRQRLARLGAFVGEDARDEATLEADARALGLERRDLVVRRHLTSMLALATTRLGAGELPSEADLAAYLAAHAEEFAEPARVRLTHVFVRRERPDGAALLAAIARDDADPASAAQRGDAFLQGAEIGPASAAELARMFGADIAGAVNDAAIGRWIGPLRSPYGLHLLWVRERIPGHLPTLAAVRARVLHRWLRERGAARAQQRMAALRARYAVTIVRGAAGSEQPNR